MSSPFKSAFMARSPLAELNTKQEKMLPIYLKNAINKKEAEDKTPLAVEGDVLSNPENVAASSGYIGEPGGGTNYSIVGGGMGTNNQSITKGMSQEPVIINAKGSNNNISSGKTRVEHRADKTRMKIESTEDAVVKRRRVARLARLEKRAAKKEIRQGKRYARKKDKGARIDAKFKGGVEGQGGKDYGA